MGYKLEKFEELFDFYISSFIYRLKLNKAAGVACHSFIKVLADAVTHSGLDYVSKNVDKKFESIWSGAFSRRGIAPDETKPIEVDAEKNIFENAICMKRNLDSYARGYEHEAKPSM